MCLPVLLAFARNPRERRAGRVQGSPCQGGAAPSWSLGIANHDWRVICRWLFIFCSSYLNYHFKRGGIGLAISAVCSSTCGLQVQISPASTVHNPDPSSFIISHLRGVFFFFSPLPPSSSLNIACPVQQMWGSDPTSIEVNSQIPIDFAESESEPLSGEQGLELSRSK